MFADYKARVLEAYDQKKVLGQLSSGMYHAKRADLKDQWLIACDQSYDQYGERLLQSFFGQKEGQPEYRLAIKKFGTDKCRPLASFIKDRNIQTDEKNIELLAWLIDFAPRPYAIWLRKQPVNTQPIVDIFEEKDLDISIETPEITRQLVEPILTPTRKTFEPVISKRMMLVLLLLSSVLFSGYWILKKSPTGQEGCMFWDKDHYESISCGQKPPDTTLTVIARDSLRQATFRKITRPDTLTAESIGKVWYIHIDGAMEYYTGPGEHPLHPDRRVLPITAYILNKYPRNN